jgi:hypothetical protein
MKHPECIRSGWCCKRAACGFGEWDEDKKQCKFLEGEEAGKYSCGKYDEIVAGMPENGAGLSPAFGGGCCATLNNDRIKLGYKPLLPFFTTK